MWFLSFIPDSWLKWFIHGVVALGLLLTFGGSIISFIPFIKSYGRLTRGLGIILIVAGIFFEGGYATEMMWRAKVRAMEEKIKIAEEKSAEANKNLSLALSNQKDIINSTNKKIIDDLNKWRNQIDADCKLNPKAIEIINQAAQKPGGKK